MPEHLARLMSPVRVDLTSLLNTDLQPGIPKRQYPSKATVDQGAQMLLQAKGQSGRPLEHISLD